MQSPRLRTVNKTTPPYPINRFPKEFVRKFAENIVYMLATKTVMSIEGEEWEQIFANCVGATWKPSNVGLDDVVLQQCCWSAKTVKASSKITTQKKVRLISGRNSPTYSYGIDRITEADPNDIGRMVLAIWNERVSDIRQYYKFARTVVLVKGKDYDEYLIFEMDTIRYEPDLYDFIWNHRGNLEGYSKDGQSHAFTWQPHGSQFTIIEDIPQERLHIKLKIPPQLKREEVLEMLHFDEQWYEAVSSKK